MAVDRKLKKSLRANLLILGDAALRYVIEEAEREIKRRRLQVRERRKKGAETVVTIALGEPEKLWPLSDSALVDAARWRW